MAIKDIFHDEDFHLVSQIKNVRQHNVTTGQRTALGAQLGTDNVGLFVWDTTENLPYVWSGSAWLTTGGVSAAAWGNIVGDIQDQADLQAQFDTVQDAIDLKLDIAAFNTFQSSLADIALSGDYSDLLNVPINIPNGLAGLDGSGKLFMAQIPAALLGSVNYQGGWNASTNTPTLVSSVGTKGHFYIVTTAGSTNLDGETDWKVGDWAIFGTTWTKVDNTSTIVGAGTANRITKWNATASITNSSLTDDGVIVHSDAPMSIGFNPVREAWENLAVFNGISANYNNVRLYLYNDGNTIKLDNFDYNSGTGKNLTIADNGGDVNIVNTATGKLGIGVHNPIAKVDIRATLANMWLLGSPLADNYAQEIFGEGTNLGEYAEFIRYSNATSGKNGDFYISNFEHKIRFSTSYDGDYSSDLVIDEGGYVGIGTDAPSNNLEVAGPGENTYVRISSGTNKQNGIVFGDNADGAGALRFGFGTDYNANGGNDFWIYDYEVGTDRFYIAPDGDVGIGTTTPLAGFKLDVNGRFHSTGVMRSDQIPGENYVGHTLYNDVVGELLQIGALGNTYPSGGGFVPRQGFIYSSAVNGLNLYVETGGSGDALQVHTASGNKRMAITGNGEMVLPGYQTQPSASFGSFLIQSYALNNNWLGDNFYYNSGWRTRETGYGTAMYNSAGNWGLWMTDGISPAGEADLDAHYTFFVRNNGQVEIPVGDLEVITSTKGMILKSPDGTRYRVTVADGGALTTTAL